MRLISKTYDLPPFLSGNVSQQSYLRWLNRKSSAHVRRNKRRGNTSANNVAYKEAIHRVVLESNGRDDYTGEPLNWSLISQYNNAESKDMRRQYKAKFAFLPTIDHVGDGLGAANFKICSWRTNDAKHDLTHDEFVELCRLIVAHFERGLRESAHQSKPRHFVASNRRLWYSKNMNVPAIKRMTVPEFLAWAESQDKGRYELVRGEIVAMAPERAEHVRAKQRAVRSLEIAVARAGVACEAFVDGLAIVIDDETSYEPDALVNCGARIADNTMIAPHPVIAVEVLSPSTGNLDKTTKLADYFRVASLVHYLIVDLGRRHVLHYRRQLDGTIIVAIAKEGELVFDPPGITVPVDGLLC
jgi:Uma2 family endonuclease